MKMPECNRLTSWNFLGNLSVKPVLESKKENKKYWETRP